MPPTPTSSVSASDALTLPATAKGISDDANLSATASLGADQTGRLLIDRAGWIFCTNQLRKTHLDAVLTPLPGPSNPCAETTTTHHIHIHK